MRREHTRPHRAAAVLADLGLRVLEVPTAEAMASWAPAGPGPSPHVLRLAPDADPWAATDHSDDVIARPTWVQWVTPIGDGVPDLLARQSRQRRQRSRRSLAALDGLTLRCHEPAGEVDLDEWKQLYGRQLQQHRRGIDLSRGERQSIFDPAGGYGMAAWRDGAGVLVAGLVYRRDPVRSCFNVSLGAVAPEARGAGLVTALYLSMLEVARDSGLRWFSLGHDPNLYGPWIDPGLGVFKHRIGMRPIPAGILSDQPRRTVAERMVSLGGFPTPALWFAHSGRPGPETTAEAALDGPDQLQIVSVRRAGETPDLLKYLPPHRGLELPA